jgi:hypothetical protein
VRQGRQRYRVGPVEARFAQPVPRPYAVLSLTRDSHEPIHAQGGVAIGPEQGDVKKEPKNLHRAHFLLTLSDAALPAPTLSAGEPKVSEGWQRRSRRTCGRCEDTRRRGERSIHRHWVQSIISACFMLSKVKWRRRSKCTGGRRGAHWPQHVIVDGSSPKVRSILVDLKHFTRNIIQNKQADTRITE